MNIIVLPDVFWPDHTGGISKSLLTEVEELSSRGHQIVVVTRSLKQGLPFHESRKGYELYRYPSPSKGTAFYHFYPLASIRQVSKLVTKLHKEFHFDVAYVHNPFQAVGLSRGFQKMPYIYVFHAPTSQEINIDASQGKYGWSTPLVKIINHWIEAKEYQALAKAHKIIVRSKFMEREMQQLHREVGSGKIVRIPLGVNIQRFSFVEDYHIVRKELDLPLDYPILFTVRRLVARMGLENLIVAMKQVVKQIPEVLLFIGGKGYLEDSLHAMVRELNLESNIKFLGFIPDEKLPKYYQAANLFILPTMALEGFGLVTIEALSCGTPVIATPVGANPEVLESLGKEFLCQDATPKALAERIIWFLSRDNRTNLRRRCQEYCESNFSVGKVVSSIEKILEEVSGRL